MEKVSIEISEASYKTLSSWCSVSRTIQCSIDLLDMALDYLDQESYEYEEIMNNIEELQKLEYALNDCNSAAKEAKYLKCLVATRNTINKED